jgi:hypothetical protein
MVEILARGDSYRRVGKKVDMLTSFFSKGNR